MDEALRNSLVRLIQSKFRSYPNVGDLAEDIVHEAYLSLLTSRQYTADKENYGYLSVTCVRLAYRLFMSQSRDQAQLSFDATGTRLVSETDVAAELLASEESDVILQSLAAVRDIERIVVTQRYYGDFSFTEIAEANGLKLNTVLSHHRRALEKLRPKLTRLLGLRYVKENEYE